MFKLHLHYTKRTNFGCLFYKIEAEMLEKKTKRAKEKEEFILRNRRGILVFVSTLINLTPPKYFEVWTTYKYIGKWNYIQLSLKNS